MKKVFLVLSVFAMTALISCEKDECPVRYEDDPRYVDCACGNITKVEEYSPYSQSTPITVDNYCSFKSRVFLIPGVQTTYFVGGEHCGETMW